MIVLGRRASPRVVCQDGSSRYKYRSTSESGLIAVPLPIEPPTRAPTTPNSRSLTRVFAYFLARAIEAGYARTPLVEVLGWQVHVAPLEEPLKLPVTPLLVELTYTCPALRKSVSVTACATLGPRFTSVTV